MLSHGITHKSPHGNVFTHGFICHTGSFTRYDTLTHTGMYKFTQVSHILPMISHGIAH